LQWLLPPHQWQQQEAYLVHPAQLFTLLNLSAQRLHHGLRLFLPQENEGWHESHAAGPQRRRRLPHRRAAKYDRIHINSITAKRFQMIGGEAASHYHRTSTITPSGVFDPRSSAVPEAVSQVSSVEMPATRAWRGAAGSAILTTSGVSAGPAAVKRRWVGLASSRRTRAEAATTWGSERIRRSRSIRRI